MPWARCENSLKTGEIDVALRTSKDFAREIFMYYPQNWVWQSAFVFFTNEETKLKYKIENYENIKKNDLMIGVVRDNAYYSDFWEAFPWVDKTEKKYHPQLEPSVDTESILKKLARNHVQLYPQDLNMGMYIAKKLNLKNITYYDFILFKKDYYNTFSKKSNFSSKKI